MPEGRLVVWNWAAEGAERGRQDLNALEIGAHGIERAMQIALYSINC